METWGLSTSVGIELERFVGAKSHVKNVHGRRLTLSSSSRIERPEAFPARAGHALLAAGWANEGWRGTLIRAFTSSRGCPVAQLTWKWFGR